MLDVYNPVPVRFHLDDGKDAVGLAGRIAGCQRPRGGKIFTAHACLRIRFGGKLVCLADGALLLTEQAGNRGVSALFVAGCQCGCRFVYLEFHRAVQHPVPADSLAGFQFIVDHYDIGMQQEYVTAVFL